MLNKKICIILILASILFLSACNRSELSLGKKSNSTSSVLSTDNQRKIVINFEKNIEQNLELPVLFKYVDKNIDKLSIKNATDLVLLLEVAQSNIFAELDKVLYSDKVTKKLISIYKGQIISASNLDLILDEDIYSAINNIISSNFKLYYKENKYVAMTNYDSYKKYSKHILPDIRDYFEIMSAESALPSFINGESAVSYSERFKRAKNCAEFLTEHSNSSRYSVVKYRYNLYMASMLLDGPIREITSNSIYVSNDYKIFLEQVDLSDSENIAVQNLSSFKEILTKNNYKFSAEVQVYIQDFLSKT